MKMGEEKAKHLFLVVKNTVSLGNDDYYRIYERIYIYILRTRFTFDEVSQ